MEHTKLESLHLVQDSWIVMIDKKEEQSQVLIPHLMIRLQNGFPKSLRCIGFTNMIQPHIIYEIMMNFGHDHNSLIERLCWCFNGPHIDRWGLLLDWAYAFRSITVLDVTLIHPATQKLDECILRAIAPRLSRFTLRTTSTAATLPMLPSIPFPFLIELVWIHEGGSAAASSTMMMEWMMLSLKSIRDRLVTLSLPPPFSLTHIVHLAPWPKLRTLEIGLANELEVNNLSTVLRTTLPNLLFLYVNRPVPLGDEKTIINHTHTYLQSKAYQTHHHPPFYQLPEHQYQWISTISREATCRLPQQMEVRWTGAVSIHDTYRPDVNHIVLQSPTHMVWHPLMLYALHHHPHKPGVRQVSIVGRDHLQSHVELLLRAVAPRLEFLYMDSGVDLKLGRQFFETEAQQLHKVTLTASPWSWNIMYYRKRLSHLVFTIEGPQTRPPPSFWTLIERMIESSLWVQFINVSQQVVDEFYQHFRSSSSNSRRKVYIRVRGGYYSIGNRLTPFVSSHTGIQLWTASNMELLDREFSIA
jgi:hypothetical protein